MQGLGNIQFAKPEHNYNPLSSPQLEPQNDMYAHRIRLQAESNPEWKGLFANNKFDIAYTPNKALYYSETYSPDDNGGDENPRPIGRLPLGKAGVEIYQKAFSQSDLAAELAFHVDKKGTEFSDNLYKTMSPEQLDYMRKNAGDFQSGYDEVKGNGGSHEDALANGDRIGTQALSRAIFFDQWKDPKTGYNPVSEIKFTPDQQQMIDGYRSYMRGE